MKYAGIGSRETPSIVCGQMQSLAKGFRLRGFMLRSGGAKGADKAFETGVASASHCEIFRPEHATAEAFDHAARYHPNWSACSDYAMALHARNSMIMLGEYLNDPVDFVVCWTRDGKASGGTGQALRIADDYHIPMFNLYHDIYAEQLFTWLNAR